MGKLKIQNLKKSFDSTNIIDNLSLTVEDGEFVSILGPSGSGKSTLFHLIGGLYSPEEGRIVLDGKEINGKRGFISYMPQAPSLFPWRTVIDNVILGQELSGKPDKEKALQLIDRAGLKGFEQSFPHELSGGMKQRVAFIRALLSPQPLICLDEPFSALDEFTRLEMQKWLLSIWEEHPRSVLFVTHNIEEALFLSDRVIVLSHRPATIRSEFKVPFSRPRDESIVLSEEFLQWKKKLYGELQFKNGKH
ncbi:ABC-type nitrate/sulfonate/bicarbonate transport system ATPase subunit [Bacillus pakistanensis]|uniref:ABC-type nitrate/sulfonate/bicarbonate transport system ATPase subunit n=1 Tax=Rossellomorea pakistanensis TaxID=992288 RepID=A0ABS2NFP1_9BACI|nr:ABC transporter ATP-binding protein [Bacillus pakistanensis]MBM7586376.1 ABC-type nitrate/sulfonate/bicarbonate transport system ATPase subunit [Bacillus pakistanensis]